MDFTKFVSLISSRQLFFARADRFEDQLDCAWPKRNADQLVQDLLRVNLSDFGGLLNSTDLALKHAEYLRSIRTYFAVNCWHMNAYESAAMWKLYLMGLEGVAIQSTYQKLCHSIKGAEKVRVGVVEYIDYEKDFILGGNMLASIVHKRKSFEHEREVRAAIVKWPALDERATAEPIAGGISVDVDLTMLVENVFIAPGAPSWFHALVATVIKDYGFNFALHQSDLYSASLY